ncbi:helix-turn-helix domain-containing protein [Streptomyces hygroscopicus]|uniref:helix-turn-helix domain-containing protein n=1 Tax=Streptomyces hygroscopicus TaxID=1912 RepID=UPI0036960AC4
MAVSTAGMVARRRFGDALKEVRVKARTASGERIKQSDAARAIKRDTIDRVSRFERGAAWPELEELTALLQLYGADVETRVRLETMLREGQAVGSAWWQEYQDDFPESLIQFIAYEDAAHQITTCAVNVLPALLQTENYARSFTTAVAGSMMPPDLVERSVTLRRRRRGIFDEPNVTPVEFIVSEAALHQQVGGPEVMAEQLVSLLDDMKTRPVTLRVVPFGAVAMPTHMVHLLEFAGADEEPTTAFDSQSGMTFQSRPKQVRETQHYIEAMRTLSLSVEETIKLIQSIIKGTS